MLVGKMIIGEVIVSELNETHIIYYIYVTFRMYDHFYIEGTFFHTHN